MLSTHYCLISSIFHKEMKTLKIAIPFGKRVKNKREKLFLQSLMNYFTLGASFPPLFDNLTQSHNQAFFTSCFRFISLFRLFQFFLLQLTITAHRLIIFLQRHPFYIVFPCRCGKLASCADFGKKFSFKLVLMENFCLCFEIFPMVHLFT